MSRFYAAFAIAFLLSLGITRTAATQEAREPWHQKLEVDLMGAGLDGTVNEADVSGSGPAAHLRMGGMFAYRVAGEHSAFLATLTATPLDAHERTGNEDFFSDYDVSGHQLTIDLDYGIRVSNAVEFLVGARLVYCRCTVAWLEQAPWEGLADTSTVSQAWVDPVIGFQALVPLGDVWSLAARADLGGFNAASSNTWQVLAALGLRISNTTTVRLGFRSFADDYEQNHDSRDWFRYDVRSAGPFLGVVISL